MVEGVESLGLDRVEMCEPAAVQVLILAVPESGQGERIQIQELWRGIRVQRSAVQREEQRERGRGSGAEGAGDEEGLWEGGPQDNARIILATQIS